jgi:hypothetical protein
VNAMGSHDIDPKRARAHDERLRSVDGNSDAAERHRHGPVHGQPHGQPHGHSHGDSQGHVSTRRSDDADAFMPDAASERGPLPSDDAESLAEEFIASALGGEPVAEEARDEVVIEEQGGPFLMLDEEGKLPRRNQEEEEDEGDEDPLPLETGRARRTLAAKTAPSSARPGRPAASRPASRSAARAASRRGSGPSSSSR